MDSKSNETLSKIVGSPDDEDIRPAVDKNADVARATRSRDRRMSKGGTRVDFVITNAKVQAKLQQLVKLHGNRRKAIEAAILSL